MKRWERSGRVPCQVQNEQALVCLSNREIVDASRGRTFHCEMANNLFFSNCFGLTYLAIYPPSIITAKVRPPSASTDFFNFSESRACSFQPQVSHTKKEHIGQLIVILLIVRVL